MGRQIKLNCLYPLETGHIYQIGMETKYHLKSLVKEMAQADVALFKKDIHLIKSGHRILLPEE